jgi:hypothetical protein
MADRVQVHCIFQPSRERGYGLARVIPAGWAGLVLADQSGYRVGSVV